MDEALFPRNLRGIMRNGTDSYDQLPQAIRDMHDVKHRITAKGKATISRDITLRARLAAWILQFPKEGQDIPLTSTFSKIKSGEMLHRDFAGECFSTYFYDHPTPGHFIERFGPFFFLVENRCSENGIDMYLRKIWLWRYIPLPFWLAPHINATERVNQDGKYLFNVEVRLPLAGRVIHYQGWLDMVSAE